MAGIAELKAAVAAERSVVASAITLINGLATKISENKNDPAALDALVADITDQASSLGNAVKTNTQADAQEPSSGTAPTSTPAPENGGQ